MSCRFTRSYGPYLTPSCRHSLVCQEALLNGLVVCGKHEKTLTIDSDWLGE